MSQTGKCRGNIGRSHPQELTAVDCKARWSTGSMVSRDRQKYGFFEAAVKIANISGMNNAFWLMTDDHFEIDIAEVHCPNDIRLTLHNNNNWDTDKSDRNHAGGFDGKFRDDLSGAFHDYGVLWGHWMKWFNGALHDAGSGSIL